MGKKVLLGIVILSFILIVGACGQKSKDNEKIASEYLSSNYPGVEFTYLDTSYKIDGDIYQVTYETGLPKIDIRVFIRSGNIYDDYLRTDLENKEKAQVYKVLGDYVKEKQITMYLDSPFEDDENLKERIENGEKFQYTLSIKHDEDYSRSRIEDIYSEVAKKIYNSRDNIDSIIVKNYDSKYEELYFSINKFNLDGDYSEENILKEIRNQKIIYKMDEEESDINISEIFINIPVPYSPYEEGNLSGEEKEKLLSKKVFKYRDGERDIKITDISEKSISLLGSDFMMNISLPQINVYNPILAVETSFGKVNNIEVFEIHEDKSIKTIGVTSGGKEFYGVIPYLYVNDFLDEKDKLENPEDFIVMYFIEDGVLKAEPYTWMQPEFENIKIKYNIQLIWNGESFEVEKTENE
ncbi:MAG: hypothetical protein N4A76_14170 [Firmicutes bacterium]|jgi:hypothetical protein|nr:hypothetical protein [Bacillota bacterium]